MRKIVASRSPLEFTWRNSEQLEGDLVEAVTALKDDPAIRRIALSGSVSVVRQLLDAGLLDELHLFVHPATAGSGLRLFEDGTPARAFKLLSASRSDRRRAPRLRPRPEPADRLVRRGQGEPAGTVSARTTGLAGNTCWLTSPATGRIDVHLTASSARSVQRMGAAAQTCRRGGGQDRKAPRQNDLGDVGWRLYGCAWPRACRSWSRWRAGTRRCGLIWTSGSAVCCWVRRPRSWPGWGHGGRRGDRGASGHGCPGPGGAGGPSATGIWAMPQASPPGRGRGRRGPLWPRAPRSGAGAAVVDARVNRLQSGQRRSSMDRSSHSGDW